MKRRDTGQHLLAIDTGQCDAKNMFERIDSSGDSGSAIDDTGGPPKLTG